MFYLDNNAGNWKSDYGEKERLIGANGVNTTDDQIQSLEELLLDPNLLNKQREFEISTNNQVVAFLRKHNKHNRQELRDISKSIFSNGGNMNDSDKDAMSRILGGDEEGMKAIEAFFKANASGSKATDVNGDGSVNGRDLLISYYSAAAGNAPDLSNSSKPGTDETLQRFVEYGNHLANGGSIQSMPSMQSLFDSLSSKTGLEATEENRAEIMKFFESMVNGEYADTTGDGKADMSDLLNVFENGFPGEEERLQTFLSSAGSSDTEPPIDNIMKSLAKLTGLEGTDERREALTKMFASLKNGDFEPISNDGGIGMENVLKTFETGEFTPPTPEEKLQAFVENINSGSQSGYKKEILFNTLNAITGKETTNDSQAAVQAFITRLQSGKLADADFKTSDMEDMIKAFEQGSYTPPTNSEIIGGFVGQAKDQARGNDITPVDTKFLFEALGEETGLEVTEKRRSVVEQFLKAVAENKPAEINGNGSTDEKDLISVFTQEKFNPVGWVPVETTSAQSQMPKSKPPHPIKPPEATTQPIVPPHRVNSEFEAVEIAAQTSLKPANLEGDENFNFI